MDPRSAGLLCLLCVLGIGVLRCDADVGGAVEQCKERMRARGYDCFEEGRAGIDMTPLEDVPIGSANAHREDRQMCGAVRDMWAANGMGEPDDHDEMTVLADGTVCVRRSGAARNDSDGEIAGSSPTGGRKLAGGLRNEGNRIADSMAARRILRQSVGGSGDSGRGVLQFGGTQSFGIEPGLPDTSFGRVRVPLDRSTDDPLRMVGQLSLGCSATLVGPCHYLTAGHCVWNDETFELRAGMDFNPGRNGRELGNPLGRWQALQVHPARGFAMYGDGTSDAALVQVEGTPGLELGYMNFTAEGLPPSVLLNIAGYPGDKPVGQMWFDTCDAYFPGSGISQFEEADGMVGHDCETAPGNSGSGMWTYSPDGSRTIAAIHTARFVGFRFRSFFIEQVEEPKGVHLAGDLLKELQDAMEDMECIPS